MTHGRLLTPAARPPLPWVVLLVVSLLWAQCLGQWHHTLHARGMLPATIQERGLAGLDSPAPEGALTPGDAPADTPGAAGARRAGGLAPVAAVAAEASADFSLLHHTAGSTECRLLDQLLLGDTAPAAQAAVPATLPAATPHGTAPALGRPGDLWQAYQARAPPAC